MFGDTEFELRKGFLRPFEIPEHRKIGRVELELEAALNDANEYDISRRLTEHWVRSSHFNASKRFRGCENRKELLQYRGKGPDGTWNNIESSKSLTRKELLQYRGKGPDGTWDDTGSSKSPTRKEQQNRGEGPDGASNNIESITSSSIDENECTGLVTSEFFSGLDQIFEKESGINSEKFPLSGTRCCWHCYDVYSAMCLAQGRTPPSIHASGIWRGHCMRDNRGVTACPHLWFKTCDLCGATAESAHTEQHCPLSKIGNLTLNIK